MILGTQRMFGDLTAGVRPLVALYFMTYAVLSLYFFIHAIATLRPRISIFPGGKAGGRSRAGLRFIGDVVATARKRSRDERGTCPAATAVRLDDGR